MTSHLGALLAIWNLLLVMVPYAECVTELKIEKQYIPEDCGTFADFGDDVAVHYTGSLVSGAVFDTSRQPNREPLEFKLGQGKVIQGWEQGIKGMCVGEKRKLTIPAHLGYGEKGHPPTIPPNSVLIFETELTDLIKPAMDLTYLVELAQFMMLPAVAVYLVYYLYQRYQSESDEQKKDRKDKKKKR